MGERGLVLVWLGLLVLLAASTGSALLHLGVWNSVLGLAIAALKAGLVLWFFMRLREAHALVRIAAGAGLVALAVLFGLSSADYATRRADPAPVQQPIQLAPATASVIPAKAGIQVARVATMHAELGSPPSRGRRFLG